MKRITLITSCAATLMLSVAVNANQSAELSAIEAQVEQKAAHIDQKFGLLLSYQERQNLKLALIVDKVVTPEALAAGKSAKQIAEQAFITYQITDIVEQNNLLVETELAVAKSNGEGHVPPCCD